MEKEKQQLLQNVTDAAKLFEAVTGIRVSIAPASSSPDGACDITCSFCRWLRESGVTNINCTSVVTDAGHLASQMGGLHLFFCQTGFVHFVTPVLLHGELIATAVGGPVALAPSAEVAASSVLARFSADNILLEETVKRIISLPAIVPEKISQSAELFRMVIAHACEPKSAQSSAPPDPPLPLGYFYNVENEITAAVRIDNRSKVQSTVYGILEHILTVQAKNKENAKNLCLEFALLMSRIAASFGTHSGDLSGLLYTQLALLDKSESHAEMRTCMLKICDAFTDSVFAEQAVKHNDVILRTVDYIRQNYMTKITLESAAAHVFLSPSYLSKIFKEEIGLNFNSYLNKVRIEHAKGLLLNDNVDLINIATLVGYEDQSYFSKVFKRVTGVTPKKFKISNGSVNLVRHTGEKK